MEASVATNAEVQRILDSDAYTDFIACEMNGLSRKEQSDIRGVSPSTVSAGITRIEGHIKKGTIPDPRGEGGGGPRLDADGNLTLGERKDIAENMMPGSSMFIEQTAKLDDEVALQERKIRDAQESLDTVTERRATYRDLAEKAGFNWDEYDAAVAAAETADDTDAASTADAAAQGA